MPRSLRPAQSRSATAKNLDPAPKDFLAPNLLLWMVRSIPLPGEDVTNGELAITLARRLTRATWVAREILPYEQRFRTYFNRARLSSEDVDELMQEAYCRIAMLDSVDHIDSPRAYFFSIARNLLLRRLKREQIVPFEAISGFENYSDTGTPSPEDQVASRLAVDRVLALIASLPDRCRRVVELRKIEGWSQKEIAAHLDMTEKAVEKLVWTGVRAIRAAIARDDVAGESKLNSSERAAG